MNVKTIVVGSLQENCYIVEKNGTCIIIDPGDEAQKIIDNVDKKLIGIFITHSHFDHIGALKEVQNKYKVDVNNFNIINNLEVIKTPGHTSDSLTFYFKEDNIMFVGDFLFNNGVGRCDLPTGNMNEMNKSLKAIFNYPLDTIVYPGHGPATTLRNEYDNIILK